MQSKFLILIIAMVGVGCQTVPYQGNARNVSVKPKKEGVVSLPTEYRDEDRAKAKNLMANNCSPRRPEITEEGEVAVGSKVNSQEQRQNRRSTQRSIGSIFGAAILTGKAGGTDRSSSSTTTQIKEWHISYTCKKGRRKSL